MALLIRIFSGIIDWGAQFYVIAHSITPHNGFTEDNWLVVAGVGNILQKQHRSFLTYSQFLCFEFIGYGWLEELCAMQQVDAVMLFQDFVEWCSADFFFG